SMENQEPAARAAAGTCILFSVAGTTYAVRSHEVRHMEMVGEITAVPNAPPFVEGVVFSRGQVVPVLHLRVRFGFERVPHDLRARLWVAAGGGRWVGLRADDARESVPISAPSIPPPADSLAGLSGNYLEGIATIGDRLVLVVRLAQVIDAM